MDVRRIEPCDVLDGGPTERYLARLRVLRDIDRAILAAESPRETAEVALAGLRTLVPYRWAAVILFDLLSGEGRILASGGDADTPLCAGATTSLSSAPFLADALLGMPLILADLSNPSLTHPWVNLLHGDGVRSYTSVPLIARQQVIGALALGSTAACQVSLYTLEIMADVADSLAIAMQQARLHAQMCRHAEELEERVAARTEALRLSEARFRAILESAPIGMLLADRTGRVLASNAALQAMLGHDQAGFQSMRFPLLTAGAGHFARRDEFADTARQYGELMAGNLARVRAELPYQRRDGTTIWTSLTIAPVSAAADGPALAVAMIEDVTEERATQAALMQAERLAITGRLGASLAHEINNPLQSIIGCLGLAEETLTDEAEAGRYLQVAREELRRVARTVAQLRDLQGMGGEEHSEPADINRMLSQLLTLNAQRFADQQIEVVWEPARRLPDVPVVADGLRQVFLNILLNAMDAMPAGGTLRVRTARTRRPPGVSIKVKDTGQGMNSSVLARAFEPFYTTKKKGLGLGLFTSRSIMERHGGKIDVQSREGQGTTFELWLPIPGKQTAKEVERGHA